MPHTPDRRIQHLVKRLAEVPGIMAVVLGGSQARATADRHSDLDLAIYYGRDEPFEIATLDQTVELLDDRHCRGLATGFGEWGPGVNGGAWLLIDGHHVDLLYREIDQVREAILECHAGRISSVYQLGHPLGFHNQIYLAEVNCCRPLHDPAGAIEEMKHLTASYPEPMRNALVGKHLFDADFELAVADKPAERGDVLLVAASVVRVIGFLLLVLYAVNRRYFINEKGAFAESRGFDLLPANFHTEATAVIGQVGTEPPRLTASLRRAAALMGSVRELAHHHRD